MPAMDHMATGCAVAVVMDVVVLFMTGESCREG